MRVEILDRFAPDLDEVALDSPQATFYHTGVWIESLSRAYPSMKFRCIVAEDGGEVLGYLPFFVLSRGPARSFWSLPYGTYGGAVWRGGDGVSEILLGRYVEMRRERGAQEVGLVDFHNTVSGKPFHFEETTTHVLELDSGFEEIWNNKFEKSKRRQTRKAQREGLSVAEARSVDEMRSYYAIYEERSRQWRQRLRYPETLFVELFSRGADSVKLFLVRLGGELVGGHLNFYYRDAVIAWNGVTRDIGTGTQASTLLYSECIRDACERGFRRYNLGGSLGKASLVEYKQALGATPYRYRTATWRSIGGRVTSVLRRLVSRR